MKDIAVTRYPMCTLLMVVAIVIANRAVARAAAPADQPTQLAGQEDREKQEDSEQRRFDAFQALLTGSKLVGHFTVLGRDGQPPAPEEYTIQSVKKDREGDYWIFQAGVKYGKVDLTVPMKLQVKWAGDTPVITLTDLTIPLLGTFSSRVIFYNNKYAGTWTHGEAGGHLFGVIEKVEPAKSEEAEASDSPDDN